jgi:hypothetical protein
VNTNHYFTALQHLKEAILIKAMACLLKKWSFFRTSFTPVPPVLQYNSRSSFAWIVLSICHSFYLCLMTTTTEEYFERKCCQRDDNVKA